MDETAVNIFQWNCRSIKENTARRAELKILAYVHKPHLLCISETWLAQGNPTPDLIKYPKLFGKDREIILKYEKIKLLHIYNPDTHININDFSYLVNQLGRKFVIVGDMNGHHTLWDPNIINNN